MNFRKMTGTPFRKLQLILIIRQKYFHITNSYKHSNNTFAVYHFKLLNLKLLNESRFVIGSNLNV